MQSRNSHSTTNLAACIIINDADKASTVLNPQLDKDAVPRSLQAPPWSPISACSRDMAAGPALFLAPPHSYNTASHT